jgi:ribosomal protein S18 acetylase RimI-like enzyme
MKLDLRPASDYPLPDLITILNRGFEGYVVPIHLNLPQFLHMLRKDSIDLTASRVLLVDEGPAGVALIARRGWVSRLAAMGISTEMRGKGAGSWFMEKLIQQARERNEREMVLEVIEQNDAAVRLYQKYGFQSVRRLVSYIRKEAVELTPDEIEEIDIRAVASLIAHHGYPDLPWQLSAETIATMTPPARAFHRNQAYALLSDPGETHVVIWSLLVRAEARGNQRGVEMIKAVIAHYPGHTWHVPAIFPEEMGAVFEGAGFEREELSQWQMSLPIDAAESLQPGERPVAGSAVGGA